MSHLLCAVKDDEYCIGHGRTTELCRVVVTNPFYPNRLIRAPGIAHELCSYPAVLSSSYLPFNAFRTRTALSHRPSVQWVNTRPWPCTAYLRIRNLKKPMCHYLYVRYHCYWIGWRINKDYSILFYSIFFKGIRVLDEFNRICRMNNPWFPGFFIFYFGLQLAEV
jgi:hypothetical protein